MPDRVGRQLRWRSSVRRTRHPAFVIGGNVPRRVLVRADSPSLKAFGVSRMLAEFYLVN